MRRSIVAVALMFAAVAAFANDPMAIRITVYQRMPQLQEGYAPDVANIDMVLTPPAAGWPANYDALRAALSARHKGRLEVMVAEILDPKPLQAEPSAAFFIPEL